MSYLETNPSRISERQKKYLVFLQDIYKKTKDAFVSLAIQNELNSHKVELSIFSSMIKEKILVADSKNGHAVFKWDTIAPNIYMVNELIRACDKRKSESKEKVNSVLNDSEKYKEMMKVKKRMEKEAGRMQKEGERMMREGEKMLKEHLKSEKEFNSLREKLEKNKKKSAADRRPDKDAPSFERWVNYVGSSRKMGWLTRMLAKITYNRLSKL